MRYEVVITRTQPTCGGRAPTRSEIRNVETDDPVAYVRDWEKNLPRDAKLEVERADDGAVTVRFASGVERVQYEFDLFTRLSRRWGKGALPGTWTPHGRGACLWP